MCLVLLLFIQAFTFYFSLVSEQYFSNTYKDESIQVFIYILFHRLDFTTNFGNSSTLIEYLHEIIIRKELSI